MTSRITIDCRASPLGGWSPIGDALAVWSQAMLASSPARPRGALCPRRAACRSRPCVPGRRLRQSVCNSSWHGQRHGMPRAARGPKSAAAPAWGAARCTSGAPSPLALSTSAEYTEAGRVTSRCSGLPWRHVLSVNEKLGGAWAGPADFAVR